MVTFTEEMTAVAEQLLEEFGFQFEVKSSASGINPVTLTNITPSAPKASGLAAFFDPSNSNMTGYERNLSESGRKSEKWMIALCSDPIVESDVLTVGGQDEYMVNAVTNVGPTGGVVYYKLRTTQIK